MAAVDRSRSALATVVGWVLVAVIVIIGLRFVAGTLAWAVRSLAGVIVVVGLVVAYLWLKAPSED
ncbi:MAG: hypothetical protein ACK5OX_10870 [Desertimonas sp.]